MAYGVTDAGFILKRLQDIKTEIEEAIREAFGNVNTAPDSVFGQLIGVFAKPAADVWEVLQDVYFSHYPESAEGAALDSVVGLNGVTRRAPTNTAAPAVVTGTEGTLLAAGKQASTSNDAEIFALREDVTITAASVIKTKLTVTTLTVGHTYTVTINGTPFSHVAGALSTKASIALALAIAINGGAEPVTAADDGVDSLTVTADVLATTFSVAVGSIKLTIAERWTPCTFDALNTGAVRAVVGTLTVIETPTAGWAGVDNLIQSSTGLELESDTDLRVRRLESLNILGAATLDAIRARLLNDVDDVTSVTIFENREDTVVDGRPGHSFEAVVEGGDDQDIADMLWATKPAGIQTVGTEDMTIVDSNGDTQHVYFSRPIPVSVWVDVVITEYTEESLPADWEALLKQAIYDYGEALPMGKDLIIQRWYVPIYSVAGIATAVVQHAIAAPPPWSSINLAIGATSVASMDLTRITVTAV